MEQLRRLQALVMNTSNKPAQTGTCVLVWMSAAENSPSSVNTPQMRPPIQYIWAGLSISTVSWPLSSSWGCRGDAGAYQLHVGHPHWVTMWAFGGSLTLFKVSWHLPLLPGLLPGFVSTGNWECCPSQLSYHCSISVYPSITKRKKVENLTAQFKWQCLWN